MENRPYILGETPWKTVAETNYRAAILPWGATEAHNFHLPYATDTIQSERVAAEAARRAWERGARTVVLPAVPFGVHTAQLDIPLCLNMNPSTQAALISDLTRSLEGCGIRKLLILNGHGGNDFKQIIRELLPTTSVFICACNWYACADAKQFFDEPGDHAGELETSVMMSLAPELVLPLSEAGAGEERLPRIAALREGKVWTPRRWTRVTADTGVGNPRAATPEKGSRFFDAVAEYLAQFLVEFALADLSLLYESPSE